MPFTATMNTPGYLPWSDDEPPVFETSTDAWEFLSDERERQEDDADESDTYYVLRGYMHTGHGADVVYGDTPDYEGSHDLGIAYSVVELATGMTRCLCCGDDVMDVPGMACSDCRAADCEATMDACGERGYWGCNREDVTEEDGDSEGCTCTRIPGSLDYAECAFCVDLKTHCYLCRRVGHQKSEPCLI